MTEHEKPWIGVDLDGTLAHDYGWKGASHIGSPIKRMVDRVRRWHNAGKCVKIFTARASKPECIPPIKAWLKKHCLPDLEITNVKTPGMVQMWDDRAVPMRRNRGTRRDDGRIAESVVFTLLGEDDGEGGFYRGEYREFAQYTPYWMSPENELIRVPNHLTWARANVLQGTPYQNPETVGTLEEMRRRGWLRVVIERSYVYINPRYAKDSQILALKNFAIERNKIIVDEQTQRDFFIPAEDA